MILSDLILKSKVNLQCTKSGIDSYNRCLDRDYFKNFPHTVEYCYNSRGFRDSEWPVSIEELKNAIWCVGDSFTVGLGSPFVHIWPQVLQGKSRLRTINVSMDGASNEWIARQIIRIQQEISPKNIVVMWSYFHRRESETGNSDEEKRLHFVKSDENEDLNNFKICFEKVRNLPGINFAHFLIPWAYQDLMSLWKDLRGPDWPELPPKNLQELDSLPSFVLHELKNIFFVYRNFYNILNSSVDYSCIDKWSIQRVPQLDWARDKHHFDILTSQWVADKVGQSLQTTWQ